MDKQVTTPLRYLKGVGERRETLFARLGVDSIESLLHHYPRRYLDMRTVYAPDNAPDDDSAVPVRATVLKKHPLQRISGGRTLTKIDAEGMHTFLSVLYFNDIYTPRALQEGKEALWYGKVKKLITNREMVNPQLLTGQEAGILNPVYPLTSGLTSRAIRNAMRQALELAGGHIKETLPAWLRAEYRLLPLDTALASIHFPHSEADIQSARRRLIFEELLTLQLGIQLQKERSKSDSSMPMTTYTADDFLSLLPFVPTGAQLRAINDIASDLRTDRPMNRLLQGDVGCGKTAVAAASIYLTAKHGRQSAMMAPTEILAAQHAETLGGMLSPLGMRVALLTGSTPKKERTELLTAVSAGEIDLLIGTHALLSDDVQFSHLDLVVTDEQHRFGVEQRLSLKKKGGRPNLLLMSATPIPRTLSLVLYGNMDLSVIDEMPPGRKEIKTYLVSSAYRDRYLAYVKKRALAGEQAYIVCPLVDEPEEESDRVAATTYLKELADGPLRGLSAGLIHGKMKAKQKDAVMRDFSSGKLSVLVSTTIIEVGVDVPNATLMVVENADLFGLSTLHQLRGRIGRGKAESQCILVSDSESPAAQERLSVLTKSNDGFLIAEKDLAMRGPGEILGKRQHGLPTFRIADLLTDEETLFETKAAAKALLSDPLLLTKDGSLLRSVQRMFREVEGFS